MEILSVLVGVLGLPGSLVLFVYSQAPKMILRILRGGWKNEWEVPNTSSLWILSWVPALAGVALGYVMPTSGFEWAMRLSPFVVAPTIIFLACLMFVRKSKQYNDWADWSVIMIVLSAAGCVFFTFLFVSWGYLEAWTITVINITVVCLFVGLSYLGFDSHPVREVDHVGMDMVKETFRIYVPIQIVISCLFLLLSRWFWPL